MLQTSRYTQVSISPLPEEKNLLSVIVQVRFPSNVVTIEDALQHLLKNSGFRLVLPSEQSSYLYVLYSLPLPEVHRGIGPMSLYDALSIIGNEGFSVVVNPITRSIRYTLSESYQQYITPSIVKEAQMVWENKTKPVLNKKTPDKNDSPINVYGPVKSGETLYGIANAIDIDAAIEKKILSIYRANKPAFNRNINILFEGAILRVPNIKEIESINIENALNIIAEHNKQWLDKIIPKSGKP